MMRVMRVGGINVGVSEAWQIVQKKLETEKIDLKQARWVGKLTKSEKSLKQISAPYSMTKLLKMLLENEYHFACVDAIAKNVIMKFSCKNAKVQKWFEDAQFPKRTNSLKLLRQLVKYYVSCGNGLLLKSRDREGKWVGFERLLPSELAIAEATNATTGYLEPNYIQVRNNKKKLHLNKDVIHFLEETHLSEVWGVSCIAIAINIEILNEIKKFDHNNFKNGLLIDYFIIVEGGSIQENEVLDEEGNLVEKNGKPVSAYDVIEEAISLAKGNTNSHSSILLESQDKDVRIRLERMRQEVKDGGFLKLKKDLREGIFAYHRVPARIVSQLIPSQLGGDNNSDLTLFYENKIKPIQTDVAQILASEFNNEFDFKVKAEDFDFGDLRESFLSIDEKIFK
jgi:hypothetical protein